MSSVDDPYLTSAAWLVFAADCGHFWKYRSLKSGDDWLRVDPLFLGVSSHLSPAMSLLA
jgi:hypothetical protein